MEQNKKKMETIQAVDRAFMILETISAKGSMGLNDLYKTLKINKASLLRIAYTLVQNGYLSHNEETGVYSLTLKPYEIGMSSIQNLDKLSLINSTLSDLHKETGRIAQFSVEDNNQLLCLQSIGQSVSSFSVYTNVGRRSPLYCTSAGKALLSAYSNGEILEKWKNFDILPLTSNTYVDVQELLKDIGLVRQRHYALDMEESEYNLFCIGTIIMGASNIPIGAISLSGNSMSKEEELSLSRVLLSYAEKLSGLLGYVSSRA